MARRNGRKGDYLATDDLTGFTVYASRLKRGYYGEMAVRPYQRNLQEIASPFNDPQPVPVYSGPNYEITDACTGETIPAFVGNTTIRTNTHNAAVQSMGLNPTLGQMTIGCTFIVR